MLSQSIYYALITLIVKLFAISHKRKLGLHLLEKGNEILCCDTGWLTEQNVACRLSTVRVVTLMESPPITDGNTPSQKTAVALLTLTTTAIYCRFFLGYGYLLWFVFPLLLVLET